MVATPLTVFTGELIVALPAPTQGEVKLMDCAGVNGVEPFSTVTARLAVPPEDRVAGAIVSGLRANVGKETV